jgi:hypothetical protein
MDLAALEVSTVVVIETPRLTIRVEGPNVDSSQVVELFTGLYGKLCAERSEIRGGSVSGFQIEQATEELNSRLPGADSVW